MGLLGVREGGAYIDCTVGLGGHFSELAVRAGESGTAIGLDLDSAALEITSRRLEKLSRDRALAHWQLVNASYLSVGEQARLLPDGLADGILFDFGCSSLQLDDPTRGFSFRFDGPLDMRFDPQGGGRTAADVINTFDAQELADIFYNYGEERRSRAVARRIVETRARGPILTTTKLREVVESVTGRRSGGISGGTRVFQALRIFVNNELGNVEEALLEAFECLKQGGVMASITFHSLEDRIVKSYFKNIAVVGRAEILTKKPVTAKADELKRNPRSRSARLRAIRKGAL